MCSSDLRYKGTNTDIRQIGRELDVRYVLEGSVRREGDRLRVVAQLIDTRDGKHIWSERYDRPRGEVFKVQDEITAHIAVALGRDIARATRAEVAQVAVTVGDDKFNAYDLTQAGLDLWYKGGRDNILRSREFFERAIARDATYGPAWSALVRVYNQMLVQQLTPEVPSSDIAAKMLEVDRKSTRLNSSH